MSETYPEIDAYYGQKAMSWALRNHIRVYPMLADTTYQIRGARGKKFDKRHVRLVIELNDAIHVGKEVYTQEEDMSQNIWRIYIHYYERANK